MLVYFAMALSRNEKIGRLVFGGLMFVMGILVTELPPILKTYLRARHTAIINIPDELEALVKNSPFPQGTQFLDLTRQWCQKISSDTIECRYVKEFNKYGFRGEDFPLEKPMGEFRIIIVGDSNTEGATLLTETFPQQYQLNKKDKRNIRVINAGKGGSGLFEYVLRYENICSLMDPDVVVFAITLSNDLFELLPSVRGNYLASTKEGYEEYGSVVV